MTISAYRAGARWLRTAVLCGGCCAALAGPVTADPDPPASWRASAAPASAQPTASGPNIPTVPGGAASLASSPDALQEPLPLPRRTGSDPVTAHMDDVDVRKILEIISRDSNLNIMISPNVSGRVTANLRGLSPEQALDAVLHAAGLVSVRENGIVYVYTPGEREKLAELDRKPPTRVYHLNYVRSADVVAMIRPLLTKETGVVTMSPPSGVGIPGADLSSMTNSTGGSGGGSSGGGAPPPAASGGGGYSGSAGTAGGTSGPVGGGVTGGDSLCGGEVLIVQDRESVLRTIDQIIREVDVQPVQVLIEAVIMQVTLSKDTELGINFAVLDGNALTLVGNGATLNATAGFSPASVLTAGGLLNGNSTTGFGADEHGLKFGFVDKSVTGFVRAIETMGKTQILATPRLLVLNKQHAELLLGNRLGYQTLTQNYTSTIQQIDFLNVGTVLRVRPFVASDRMVRMEVHPERSSGQVVQNIPQTSTAELTTNVMVPDGATLVIGGLMEDEDDKSQSGLPVLGQLPVIGALFRERVHSNTKNELIVLLTPHICNPGVLPAAPTTAIGGVQPAAYRAATAAALTADLRGSAAVALGADAVYEFEIINHAQQPASGLGVQMALSAGLHPETADGPTDHEVNEQRVLFHMLPELPAGGRVVYRLRARALQQGEQGMAAELSSLAVNQVLRREYRTRVAPGGPVISLGQPASLSGQAITPRASAPP